MSKGFVIIATGDRTAQQPPYSHDWMGVVADALIDAVSGTMYECVLIHGDCTGIDQLADIVASHVVSHKFREPLRFPVTNEDWRTIGKKAGPLRNSQMLAEGLKIEREEGKELIVMAFHDDIRRSRGTKDMVRQAQRAKVPVRWFTRRGEEVEVPKL